MARSGPRRTPAWTIPPSRKRCATRPNRQARDSSSVRRSTRSTSRGTPWRFASRISEAVRPTWTRAPASAFAPPGAPVPGPALDRPRRRPARDRAERRAGPGAVHVPGVDRHSEGGRRETLRAALPEQAAGGREPGLRHARLGGVGVIHLEARHGRSGSRVPPGAEGGGPYATRYGGRARASDRPPRDVREGGDRDRGAALVPHHELQFARRDRRSRICGVDREPPRSERRARPSQAEAGEGHGPRGLRRDLRRDRRDHAGTEQGHGGRLSGPPPKLTLNKG